MCTYRTTLTALSLGAAILLSAPATHAQLQSVNPQTVTGQVSAVEGESTWRRIIVGKTFSSWSTSPTS